MNYLHYLYYYYLWSFPSPCRHSYATGTQVKRLRKYNSGSIYSIKAYRRKSESLQPYVFPFKRFPSVAAVRGSAIGRFTRAIGTAALCATPCACGVLQASCDGWGVLRGRAGVPVIMATGHIGPWSQYRSFGRRLLHQVSYAFACDSI